jgi:hypothetical protein
VATLTEPETTAPEGGGPPAGRLTWRRVIFGGLLGLLGGFGLVHVIGGEMTALIAGGSATAGAVGYGTYKIPHVRRHFWGPWSGRNREGKGQKGFSRAWQRNWQKTWKSPGSPFRGRSGKLPGTGSRRGGGLSRKPRAGSGSRSRGLRRSGAGQGRRAGMFRRSGRGSGASRRSSPFKGKGLGKFGKGRSGSGRKGLGKFGKGGSGRKGLGKFGKGGSGRKGFGKFGKGRSGAGRKGLFGRKSGTGSGRKGLFRGKGRSGIGSGSRRRMFGKGRSGTGSGRKGLFGKGRSGMGSGSRRRSVRHPFGGKRFGPRMAARGRSRPRGIRHPFGGKRTSSPKGRSRPRSIRHPFGGRRTRSPVGRSRPRSLIHPRGGRRTGPRRPPGRMRRGWQRMFGTPSSPRLARRGWHRVFGTPQQRHMRRRAARARRANARNRRRRASGTYGRRPRWYAPWRGRSRRGRVSLRHRIGNRIGNWRARRAKYRGLLRGTGRTPFRLRMRHWRARIRSWSPRRWLANRRRNRRMPRPLLGGRHRAGSQSAALHRFGRTRLGRWLLRRDRRRRQAWAGRQRRARPTPVPDTSARPVIPVAGSNGHKPGKNTTGGRDMADVQGASDQIKELVQDWIDANDLDETLENLHYFPRAMEEAFSNFAEKLREDTQLGEHIPEAVAEAGSDMNGIADKLQQAIDYGVQRG